VLATAPVSAQDDLAKQSQNPVAKLISVPFENNTYFEVGPDEKWANVFLMKPVYPVNLGKWNLINRFIMPVIYQEERVEGEDSEFGLEDLTYQAFFSPAEASEIIWGLGPVLGVNFRW
jgi:hypothetical protein